MGKYYVFYTVRTKEGRQATYGPYSLKSAQDQSRISSQHGSPAEVWRGRPRTKGAKRVRRYEKGRRAFPVTNTQLKGLTRGELPTQLKGRGRRNPTDRNQLVQLDLWVNRQGAIVAETTSPAVDEDLLSEGINLNGSQIEFKFLGSFLRDMLKHLSPAQRKKKTDAVKKALNANKSVIITTTLGTLLDSWE